MGKYFFVHSGSAILKRSLKNQKFIEILYLIMSNKIVLRIYFNKECVVKVFDVINLRHIQATMDSQIVQHFLVAVQTFANVWRRVKFGEELIVTRALRFQYQEEI
jgi:hypothetical protein